MSLPRLFGGPEEPQPQRQVQQHEQQQEQEQGRTRRRLFIAETRTHSVESVSVGGRQRENVHVVIKNSPFRVLLSTEDPTVELAKITYQCGVLYASDAMIDTPGTVPAPEDERPVDFIRSTPMTFKSLPQQQQQQQGAAPRHEIEFRLAVLSSQHEDSLFCIKIVGCDPETKRALPGLTVVTPPMKSVSKPEGLKKRPASKKRSQTDQLLDHLKRIEEQQAEQRDILQRLLEQQEEEHLAATTLPPAGSVPVAAVAVSAAADEPPANFAASPLAGLAGAGDADGSAARPTKRARASSAGQAIATGFPAAGSEVAELSHTPPVPHTHHPSLGGDDLADLGGVPPPVSVARREPKVLPLEDAFKNLVSAFGAVDRDARPEIIRRMVQRSTVAETEAVREMVDLLESEGLGGIGAESAGDRARSTLDNFASSLLAQTGCSCIDCPHKRELESVESTALWSGLFDNPNDSLL